MRDLTGLTTTVELKDESGHVVGTREVVLYRTLLDLAHEEGVSGIATKMLQAPSAENGNTCIFRAEVITKTGTFTGVGDANPANVDPGIAQHFIRAAETRAKARALRDALNIGVVTLEEIQGNGFGNSAAHGTGQKKSGQSKPKKNAQHDKGDGDEGDGEVPLITESQRKYLFRLLSDQGLESNDALNYLLDECGVDSIKRITRKQASDLISKLKGDNKPKGDGDELPY